MSGDSITITVRLDYDENGKPVIYLDAPGTQPPQSREEWFRKNLPPTVLFTGFKTTDKTRLEELAEKNKLIVCKSVRHGLTFIVGGYNAGPSKIENAKEEGATFLTEEQFVALLATGEVPSQMPI